MKNKRKIIIIIIVVFIIYSVGLYKLASNPTSIISTKTNDRYLARFIENYNILKENWYYFTSEKEVIGAATNAMVLSNEKNDVYTTYIPAENSKEYFANMETEYVGLGVRYIKAGDYPLIAEVFIGSPAQKAKIQVGDSIIQVDGKTTKGIETEEIRKLIEGKVGEKRNLTLLRNNKQINITVTLAQIESSASYKIINQTGYLDISEFSNTTANEVERALKYFESKNIKKVIIDLRDNPGGYLTTLEKYKTVDNKQYKNNYVILVNGNTASAGEAFTACLNENLAIPIYGEKTFGKGIMQDFFKFPDDAYLKYTNAAWLTPKGHAINQKGITPTNKINKSAIFSAASAVYNFDKDIKYDTVSSNLIAYQKALKALGYQVDREDGYYSSKTRQVIESFKQKYAMGNEKDLSRKVQAKIVERIFIEKNNEKNDLVLNSVLK